MNNAPHVTLKPTITDGARFQGGLTGGVPQGLADDT